MGHPTHYSDFKAIMGLKSASGPQVHGPILDFMGLVPKTNPVLTAHCPKAPLGIFFDMEPRVRNPVFGIQVPGTRT